MTRSILASATLAALVALSGCSSDDDDADPTILPGGNPDGTSELGDDREIPAEPGGDTSAIAGYWDAPFADSGTGSEPGSRFVVLSGDGLQTSYERQLDDLSETVCYSRAGPQTLTPDGDDLYSPADGSSTYRATRSEDGSVLTVTQDDIVQTWTLVEEGSPDDLTPCSASEGDSSMFNPDLAPSPPDPEPSGNDTSAIAGLWDASGGLDGQMDERYVAISANGLWTDYDFRQDDLASEGNCYLITPLRLDLETLDAAVASYSIADGRSFDAGPAAGDTLELAFHASTDDERTAASWTRVSGQSEDDLEACSAE